MVPSVTGSDVGVPPADRTDKPAVPGAIFVFLFLSIAIFLSWSNVRLLWADEFAALQTQNVGSAAILLHLQRTSPISMEPPVYDLLGHAAIKVFGAGPFALRLPALCGFLLMQVCLFRFVRRIAGESAGVFAAGATMLFWSSQYAIQARPYGTLLGWCGVAMLSWQTAIRDERKGGSTPWRPLILLTVSIGLAINTHYYGVLLLVPLCAAELIRSYQLRRFDLRVGAAICLGAVSVLGVLPFTKAASAYRAHFFSPVQPDRHFVTNAYAWMMFGYNAMGVGTQRVLVLGCGLLVIFLAVHFARHYRGSNSSLSAAEGVFLVVMAGLPLAGFVMSRMMVIVIEGRYILPAMIGVAGVLGVLMAPLMRSRRGSRIVLGALFVAVAVAGVMRTRAERKASEQMRAAMALRPDTMAILGKSEEPIYVFNSGVFDLLSYYAPDAGIRSRMRLAYSRPDELEVAHSDYVSLSAANTAHFVPGKVIALDALMAEPDTKLFVGYDTSFDWTEHALKKYGEVQRLGPGLFGTEVFAVRASGAPR